VLTMCRRSRLWSSQAAGNVSLRCLYRVKYLTVIPKSVFVQDAARSLMSYIRYPDTADSKAKFLASLQEFVP
jgi:hypothetical protein